MAIVFIPENLDGQSPDWAPTELKQLRRGGLGANTMYLYISAGALYLSPGKMGFYNGSSYGSIENDAAINISLAGLTVSQYAKVEVSVSGTVVTIATTSTGEADPTVISAVFAAAYDGTKGGFYITATKRCPGMVWIDASGNPAGVVNQIPGCYGYSGYATTIGTTGVIIDFYFLDRALSILRNDVYSKSTTFTIPSDVHNKTIICTAGGWNLTFPSAATFGAGNYIDVYIDYSGVTLITCVRVGAETFNGLATLTLGEQYRKYRFTSDGTNWLVGDIEIEIAYTPVFSAGFGACTNIDFTYVRRENRMYVQGKFNAGNVAASEAQIGLPGSLTSDSGIITNIRPVGLFLRSASAPYLILAEATKNYVTVSIPTSGTLTKQNGNGLLANTELVTVFFELPITTWNV